MRAERFGLFCEVRALSFLKKNGLTVLKTRFRTRFGEIDFIAEDKGALVLLEVKAGPAGASERADQMKRARLQSAAAEYLTKHPYESVRFDVLEENEAGFRLIKNAF